MGIHQINIGGEKKMEEERMTIRSVIRFIEAIVILVIIEIGAGLVVIIAPTTEWELILLIVIVAIVADLLFIFMDKSIDYIFARPRKRSK